MGALIPMMIGAAADVFNAGTSIWQTNKQLELQKEAWEREDSAVQRRVADLKAAGLSPVLAAGSAAGSSGPINVSAPKANIGNAFQAQQLLNAKEQNALTSAQIDYTNAQLDKLDADSFVSRMMRDQLRDNSSVNGRKMFDYIGSQIDRAIAENKMAIRSSEEVVRNTDMARAYGIPSNSSNAMEAVTMGRLAEGIGSDGVKTGPLASVIYGLLKALK